MGKRSITVVVLVVVLLLGGILYATLSSGSEQANNQPTATSTQQSTSSDNTITRTTDALHQYQPDSGQHIVAGTTTVPTPCHQLSTDSEIQESEPQQVFLNFSSSQQDADGVCAQQIQEVRFRVAFTADEGAEIVGGTFDGDAVELNLRELGADQNLENFDVYTKG